MIQFATPEETLLAMRAVARWLPELARRLEAGLRRRGLVIVERCLERHTGGASNPVLRVRTAASNPNDVSAEVRLLGALTDFLSVDRHAKPLRFDRRVLNAQAAVRKLAGIVESRVALATSQTEAELARKLEALAPRFQVRRWYGAPSAGNEPEEGSYEH